SIPHSSTFAIDDTSAALFSRITTPHNRYPMENHHLCQASIVIQQPTSVTALESGAVFQEAGGYCSTTGGPSHVPTTASTGVEATRIMSKVIVIVNSIVLAFYVFMHIGGDFAGPIVALHVLSSVIGIAIGRKARRSFSKSSFKLAALVFALEFAMYAVFLWIW
ncbi:unnamed protein product, partial [Pylaiella littoralis]